MEHKKFYNYDVYENGEIYSHYSNKFLTHDIVKGYHQVSLYIDGKPKRYKVHRLVGMLFLDCPKNYDKLQINHKDGNKDNNQYTNLEWCTSFENNKHARVNGLNDISKSNSERWNDSDFRMKTSKKISQTTKENGTNRGVNNPNFRYKIISEDGKLLSRQEIFELIGIYKNMSSIDAMIAKSAAGIPQHVLIDKGISVIDTKQEGQSTIERIA